MKVTERIIGSPSSYWLNRVWKRLHCEVVRDESGAAIPVVQVRVWQQGRTHCGAHELLQSNKKIIAGNCIEDHTTGREFEACKLELMSNSLLIILRA